jgi:hypothetical protein
MRSILISDFFSCGKWFGIFLWKVEIGISKLTCEFNSPDLNVKSKKNSAEKNPRNN